MRKKVKIQNSKFVEIRESLVNLAQMDLPVVQSLAAVKNLKEIEAKGEIFNEVRKKLLKKYGEDKQKNGQVVIPKEKMEDFNKEFKELLDQEIELDIHLIKFTESIPKIKPKFILDLEFMLDLKEDKKTP